MTRVGTNCFVSRAAAYAYYALYGHDEADVDAKIASGAIYIGTAHLRMREGDRLVRDKDGRYHIVLR